MLWIEKGKQRDKDRLVTKAQRQSKSELEFKTREEKCQRVERKVVKLKVSQPHPTLYDTMDGSPSGSSVHGILQARRLEQVAMPLSSGSS